jgi:multiple sugar transport system permease protein
LFRERNEEKLSTQTTQINEIAQPKLHSKKAGRFAAHWAKYGTGYLFLAPFVILFTIFVIVPFFVSLGLSFTYYNMLEPPKWLGLDNYKLLFLEDDVFLIGVKNTLIFALVTGPIGYFASFFAAWVINELNARKFFSLAFYAPSITSATAMSVIWLYIFSPDRYGLINNLLIKLGIITSTEPVLWTSNPKTILPVIMVISIWMSMGTGFLVFLAGLQNMPGELYDAANIDGVRNVFQKLWYITLPMMKPQLLFGAVNSIVSSFNVFSVATTVAGFPSPDYAGHTIVAHLYDYAFIRFEMGYASAIAVFLFVLTFLLGRICMKAFSSKDIY